MPEQTRWTVYLESAEFGREEFRYDSAAAAEQGYRRLRRAARAGYQRDGIQRRLAGPFPDAIDD